MSEYWVSQAKHYCKFCNIWIADNKPSKQLHESSVRHKMAVDLFHKEKREKTLHGARSEKELKMQLIEIEKAANEAIKMDRIVNGGQFYQAPKPIGRPPPPPPIFGQKPFNNSNDEEEENLYHKEESTGMYEIRGQTYLEGTMHQDKLKEGVKCEIFIELEDIWVPAVVTKKRETSVPNTSITLKSFDVNYTRDEAFTDKKTATVEESVKADRLRILANKDGSVMGEGDELETPDEDVRNSDAYSSKSTRPNGMLSQSISELGGGGWSTVSVEVIDDEEETQKEIDRQRELEQQRRNEATAHTRANEISRLAAAASESVLSSVDPYGTGMYKGKFIGEADITEDYISKLNMPMESLSQGVAVGFKKRKRPTNQIYTSSTSSSSISSSSKNCDIIINTSDITDELVKSVNGTVESKTDDSNGTGTEITISSSLKPTSVKFKVIKKCRDFISYDD